ncbi:hypothetical protein DICVIV_07416 [Dictyocaulus viviparus]|uniref:MGAT4 conserved region domain-containing protein n=1 Tax=Dictyocaulus viviparus TaxID=29172 RepID=A0A0D8XRT7_DICVI|nr:hypothetical protein DICVIV_07416 [Dictyocaulus viviparus]
MHFCSLGFIGKLIRSSDVIHITYAIASNFLYKPVDWIFFDVEMARFCSPEKEREHCKKAVETSRVNIRPSQFQHVGFISSLSGKKQKLTEPFFEIVLKKLSSDNPPAIISTSMSTFEQYTTMSGYEQCGVMWFTKVRDGDFLTIKFEKPEKVVGLLMISGIAPASLDKFGPETKIYASYANDVEKHIGEFSKEGDVVIHLDGITLDSLTLRVTKNLTRWVILGHVVIDVA